ncbi:hypothetical protein SH449x_004172 [Pirellulaceae bacterium SH449]
MDNNQQELRRKLEETKAQLFSKLQILEEQLTETIESTGTKFQSTAGAVESAVHSFSNALNVKKHFELHPWWCLVGAVAAGYITGGTRCRRAKPQPHRDSGLLGIASLDSMNPDDANTQHDSTASLTALSAAYDLGSRQSTATQARSLALNATVRIIEEVLARTVPIVIDHFSKKQDEGSK